MTEECATLFDHVRRLSFGTRLVLLALVLFGAAVPVLWLRWPYQVGIYVGAAIVFFVQWVQRGT